MKYFATSPQDMQGINEDNQALYLRPSKVNWMELRDVK